jgi:hypothetical protein
VIPLSTFILEIEQVAGGGGGLLPVAKLVHGMTPGACSGVFQWLMQVFLMIVPE